jgi:hypothetical protein
MSVERFESCPFRAFLYQCSPLITLNKCTCLINTILQEHHQHVSVQVIIFRFLNSGILFSLAVHLVGVINSALWMKGFT